MDVKTRLEKAKARLVKVKKMKAEIVFATEKIKTLEDGSIENSSALVKYRENFSVPAVWIVRQGIRVANIPQIPAENISGLNTYIQANTTNIDGGDLDAI